MKFLIKWDRLKYRINIVLPETKTTTVNYKSAFFFLDYVLSNITLTFLSLHLNRYIIPIVAQSENSSNISFRAFGSMQNIWINCLEAKQSMTIFTYESKTILSQSIFYESWQYLHTLRVVIYKYEYLWTYFLFICRQCLQKMWVFRPFGWKTTCLVYGVQIRW